MKWRNWLPSAQQMSNAAQLRKNAYDNSTMQQSMGMIVVLSLLAGLLPFMVNWIVAAQMGTALPLAEAARSTAGAQDIFAKIGLGFPWLVHPTAMSDFYQTLAGLNQTLPDWLVAGLSALAGWIQWPLGWLSTWIVYGIFVMIANKGFGGHVTLQRFYAATGFAATPLLLTALSPVPCLGALATIAGMGWSLAVYVRANAEITGLPLSRAAGAVLLPIPILALLSMMVAGFMLLLSLLVI